MTCAVEHPSFPNVGHQGTPFETSPPTALAAAAKNSRSQTALTCTIVTGTRMSQLRTGNMSSVVTKEGCVKGWDVARCGAVGSHTTPHGMPRVDTQALSMGWGRRRGTAWQLAMSWEHLYRHVCLPSPVRGWYKTDFGTGKGRR